MTESAFRGALSFLNEIGVYDVVLPFLLVFTILFAILEKTKVLGTEEIEGHEYTRKNMNAIVAFVIAFLVVLSTRLVAIINEALGRIVLLLLISVTFLLLVGSFYKEGEPVHLTGGWKSLFMIIMFLGVVLIFLQAIKLDDGRSVLEGFWEYLVNNWTSNFTASVILLIIIVIFILYVTASPKGEKKEPESSSHKH
ncbi:hypothetical protein HYS47_05095 [Candidatus Woesearchaeota archaeon]|nr:hypothetical protein [Candidatus Woesearchaeota archaeon]